MKEKNFNPSPYEEDPCEDPDYYEEDLTRRYGVQVRICYDKEKGKWGYEIYELDMWVDGFDSYEEAKEKCIEYLEGIK